MQTSMLAQLKRLLGLGPKQPREPLELTVQDQWALKFLFLVRHPVSEKDIVEAVMEERPTLIPHEVVAAVKKLHLVGALEQDELGRYRIAAKARKLKSVLQEQPSVNIDYYG